MGFFKFLSKINDVYVVNIVLYILLLLWWLCLICIWVMLWYYCGGVNLLSKLVYLLVDNNLG